MTGTTLSPPRPDTGDLGRRHRRGIHEGLGNAALVVGAWLLLVLATTIARPDFLSHQTLLSVTFTMSVSGVLALAQALVAISGGILDLSIPTALILPSWLAVTLAAGSSYWWRSPPAPRGDP
jgi:ribose/xylose/arabinose/galactoside ABC-type transport system permease subunit